MGSPQATVLHLYDAAAEAATKTAAQTLQANFPVSPAVFQKTDK